MQYSYKTQELIEKGVDFATLFPEKQAAVQQMTGVDFSLPQIVQFLGAQTENFTKENLLALDLDKYIYGIYLKHTTAKEKENTPPPPVPEPPQETAEDLQASIEGLEILLPGTKGAAKKELQKTIEGLKAKLALQPVKMELGGMVPNSHKATLITALVHHFGISRADAIKVVNESKDHQALIDLMRNTPVQQLNRGGSIWPSQKEKDFQRAKQKLNREYLVHQSMTQDEWKTALNKLHSDHGIMVGGGRISFKNVDIKVGEKFKLQNGEIIEIKRLFTENIDQEWVEYTRDGKTNENSVQQLRIFLNNWKGEKLPDTTMARGGIVPTKAGQIVKYKTVVDPGDEDQEYEIIWLDAPRAEIKALNTGMSIAPTTIAQISDLKVVKGTSGEENYDVTVHYQSTSGKPLSKRFIISAKDEDDAIEKAHDEVKKLRNFLKIVGGDVIETPQMKDGGYIKGLCQTGTEIQTFIFSKDHWNYGQVLSWAKNHGFKYDIDEKKESFHLRQQDPNRYFKKSFRTTSFNDKLPAGILAVTGCPKKSKKA